METTEEGSFEKQVKNHSNRLRTYSIFKLLENEKKWN